MHHKKALPPFCFSLVCNAFTGTKRGVIRTSYRVGVYGAGFVYNTGGNTVIDVYDFDTSGTGYKFEGGLVQAQNGLLYGMSYYTALLFLDFAAGILAYGL